MSAINERIKAARKRKGISQAKAAEMLGMKRSTYAYLEQSANPKIETLKDIAAVFGVPETELLNNTPRSLDFEPISSRPITFEQSISIFDKFENFSPTVKEIKRIIKMRSLSHSDLASVDQIIDSLAEKAEKERREQLFDSDKK